MPWRRSLSARLTAPLRRSVNGLTREEALRLTEIRVNAGRPVRFFFTDGKWTTGEVTTLQEIDELIGALCAHSRYAYEAQMTKGYIPLQGGHRAGVCGRVIYENGVIVRMSAVTSICIRIAREVHGSSMPIREHLCIGGKPARVLLLGPPGAGKTTVLRDAAKYLSFQMGFRVAAADEREELFSQEEALDIDVLRGADKSDAVTMLVRSLSPQIIVCDEIGREADALALLNAVSCGVGVLASAHADSFGDLMKRPVLRVLEQNCAFERYILLEPFGRLAGVLDSTGKEIQ